MLNQLVLWCAIAAIVPAGPMFASEWQAGFAAVKITPERPVAMAGYASRNKPSEGIAADLYAKVLVLEDANGQRAVWITTDLIGLRGAVTEAIVRQVIERTGLKRHQLLINSSHTHTGPAIADSDTSAYSIADEATAETRAYRQMLQQRLVAAVEQALARLEPVELSYGSGVVPFVMNRREFTRDRGVILGVNPRGPADRTMPLLKVSSPGGAVRAVVFGAATHNTTLTGDEYRITGDYAGFAQHYVQQQMPGVQAMFVLGFAGDSNPHPRGTIDLARQHGETLGKEVVRVLGTKLAPVRGTLSLQFDHVDIPLAGGFSRADLEQMTGRGSPSWRSWMAGRMLEVLDKGDSLPAHYRAPIAVWQFGSDLTLVALSGEVVVDYAHLIEQAIGPLQLWLSAYNNDVFGYLPSARVLEEGGYETRGVGHGGPGFFSPKAQDAVVAKVRELAAKAGRVLGDGGEGPRYRQSEWQPLFDGKTIKNWQPTKFGGEGVVGVEDGQIVLEMGVADLTGITWAGPELPKTNYELALQARRLDGNDFFAGITFPVADSFCSLILGGWGGTVVGLSSIDGMDASENATSQSIAFDDRRWYDVRIRVTPEKIQAWLDEKPIVDQDITGKKIDTRVEVELSQPLGVAAWRTKSAVRNIRLRRL
jgi:hypothetical protein